MENKTKRSSLSKQLQELADERDALRIKKGFLEEAKEHWGFLQQQEEALLEEVSYLSQEMVLFIALTGVIYLQYSRFYYSL